MSAGGKTPALSDLFPTTVNVSTLTGKRSLRFAAVREAVRVLGHGG